MIDKKPIVVAVSGGFDPIHPGHIRMFKEAKALGDKLVVILNNDNWLQKKKKFNFMSEKERKEVISALRDVDDVMITRHPKNRGATWSEGVLDAAAPARAASLVRLG